MQVLSPPERQMVGAGTSLCLCFCRERAVSKTDMPMPSSLAQVQGNARIFADTVTDRELWPV